MNEIDHFKFFILYSDDSSGRGPVDVAADLYFKVIDDLQEAAVCLFPWSNLLAASWEREREILVQY
jgi:hypothetical protein